VAFVVVLRLGELRLGGGDGGLCGAQRVELVLRLELRHHLAGLDAVADIDGALDHAPADAERQAGFCLRLDTPGVGEGFADIALLDDDRSHRPNLRRYDFGFALAGRKQGDRR
jgi:hypothetical protein